MFLHKVYKMVKETYASFLMCYKRVWDFNFSRVIIGEIFSALFNSVS